MLALLLLLLWRIKLFTVESWAEATPHHFTSLCALLPFAAMLRPVLYLALPSRYLVVGVRITINKL